MIVLLLLLLLCVQMPQRYTCSRFRHVIGKAAVKGRCYHGLSITHSVQDNHFCAVNPCFIAIVTECTGGGAFIVISVHQVRPRPLSDTLTGCLLCSLMMCVRFRRAVWVLFMHACAVTALVFWTWSGTLSTISASPPVQRTVRLVSMATASDAVHLHVSSWHLWCVVLCR